MEKKTVLFSRVTKNGHLWLVLEGIDTDCYAGMVAGRVAPSKGDVVMYKADDKGYTIYW